ncbi:hypothetical protein B0O99DRAFT_622192 [Bisporella sp. PMI_857]|nr:hypothetical protein B0O99DRAFT_622192 [Bisporella sp. PMI_857]
MQAQPQMLQQQSDSAFANQQRYSELGAQPKPPAAAFAPPPGAEYYAGGDKAGFNSVAQEYRPHGVEFSGPGSPNPQSPPPVYAQPVAHSSLQPNSPHSNYTELANTGRNSLTPTSPTSLYSPAGANTPGYNPTSSPSQSNPGTFAPSAPAPPPPSELGANPAQQQYAAYQPNVPNPGTQELNGTGNIPRRPVRQSAAMDMSGNPLNENYHHELA